MLTQVARGLKGNYELIELAIRRSRREYSLSINFSTVSAREAGPAILSSLARASSVTATHTAFIRSPAIFRFLLNLMAPTWVR